MLYALARSGVSFRLPARGRKMYHLRQIACAARKGGGVVTLLEWSDLPDADRLLLRQTGGDHLEFGQ